MFSWENESLGMGGVGMVEGEEEGRSGRGRGTWRNWVIDMGEGERGRARTEISWLREHVYS